MSEAEDPNRLMRAKQAHVVTVEDVRQLMGASTPHFALQLRNRIARLIADLPPEHPARVEGEREITFSVRSRLLERANRLADALERVRSGEYGACEVCGCAIVPARLRAMPEVTTCVACQDAVERVTCRTGSGER